MGGYTKFDQKVKAEKKPFGDFYSSSNFMTKGVNMILKCLIINYLNHWHKYLGQSYWLYMVTKPN